MMNMDAVWARALQLVRLAGPKQLSTLGGKNYDRWRNISRGVIRMSTTEIAVLAEAFPEYALWLVSGRIEPENGHRSPDLDKARSSHPG